MKKKPLLFTAALVAAVPLQASNLAVNLGAGFTNSPEDEAGFENVTVANNVNGPLNGLATIDGVTIGLDEGGTQAEEIRSVDRGDPGAYSGPLGTLTNTWAGCENPGTSMLIVLSGVTSGEHTWTSYHMDESNQTGNMDVSVSVDGGLTFTPVGPLDIWDTNTHNGTGTAPTDASQFAFTFNFTANGIDDVIVEIAPAAGAGGGTDFTVTNGFTVEEVIIEDVDGDGLADPWEIVNFGNLDMDGTGDPDGDGATNEQEETADTNPNNSDSDGDGLTDGDEINTHGTNPLDSDSDGDGIDDEEEVLAGVDGFITDPNNVDSDGDGIEDGEEVVAGADGFLTDPTDADTDGDGIDDGTEAANVAQGLDPTVDSSAGDADGDGLSNGDEANVHSTDPLLADTDGDTIDDFEEVNAGADGFVTDPNSADTDGDLYSDPVEVANTTDPTDDTSLPRPYAELAVDFNSNQDQGGSSAGFADPADSPANHLEFGYQSYHANHEVIAEFATANYPAFGTTITLTVDFPDTTDNRVQQSIDRTDQDAAGNVLGSFDGNWGGDRINLLTDWIGVDTRTGNGGNGPYDGVSGTPTRMTMDLGGLPAGSYTWRSFHHDTEHMNPQYIMEVSTDGGLNFFQIGGVRRSTDSTPGGTPASPDGEFDGVTRPASGDPVDLPSTVNTCFIANGIDNVQFRYTPYSTAQVHQAFFMMNGFEIDEFPNDSDDDCFDDTDETAAFGDLSQGPFDDFDGDGLDNITEIIRGTDPTQGDSDMDGLDDGGELAAGTDPSNPDTDGDGLNDGDEVNVHNTDPVLEDTDNDTFLDGYEVDNMPPFDPLVDDFNDDFDGDTLINGEENIIFFSDPLEPDSDGDTLRDDEEVFVHGTDPNLTDSDGDGLADGDEVNVHGTDPAFADTDGDGADDGFEVANNPPYDPLVDNSLDDFDGDGLTTLDEGVAGTDVTNPDTDGDGLSDGVEWFTTFTNPTLADTDRDGLEDGVEDANADGIVDPGETDATMADTDLDGYNDKREIDAGTLPDDILDFPQPPADALFIDFDNGGNQDGGFHFQAGYQSYIANHEAAAEFTTQSFTAFGTTIDVTPTWPDTSDNRVQQMIDRGAGNDANWNGDLLNLLTDWLGSDTRTGQGGNGNYDGVSGAPTTLLLTIANLPAGQYNWRSYHHDTENMHAMMTLEFSTDGGLSFAPAINTTITDSTPGGNPTSPMTYDGPGDPGSFDPADLPSTVNTTFTATGIDDVVVRIVPFAQTAVHSQFAVINGFEITSNVVVPEGVILTEVSEIPGGYAISGSGFDTDTDYVLRRSTDGENWSDVGAAFSPATETFTVQDTSPLPDPTVLYQFWAFE